MATIPTEFERILSSDQDNRSASTLQPPSPDYILAEIPVVVHHRSTRPGEEGNAQTVREETTTIMIFPQGALLRLSSKLLRGDLVLVSNQQNRAVMLCRVAHLREQPAGPGYIELEFTQRSSGFWTQGAPVTNPALSASKVVVLSSSRSAEAVGSPASIPPAKVGPAGHLPVAMAPAPILAQAPIASTTLGADSKAASTSETNARVPPVELIPFEVAECEPSRLAKVPQETAILGKFRLRLVLVAAGVCLLVLALFAGGYFLGHRGQENSAAELATAHITYPAPPAVVRTDEAPSSDEANPVLPAPRSPASPTLPKSEASADLGRRKVEKVQPHQSSIPIGEVKAPIAKPAGTALSEPPPELPTQGTNLFDTLLGTGSFVNATAPRSPAQPVPATNSTMRVTRELLGPKIISSVAPIYPLIARAQGLTGMVVVDATIDASGNVTGATVVSGPDLLRQAALNAVLQWKYQPAELNGQAVLIHQTIDVNFVHH